MEYQNKRPSTSTVSPNTNTFHVPGEVFDILLSHRALHSHVLELELWLANNTNQEFPLCFQSGGELSRLGGIVSRERERSQGDISRGWERDLTRPGEILRDWTRARRGVDGSDGVRRSWGDMLRNLGSRARLCEAGSEMRRERDIAKSEIRPNEARVRGCETRRDLPSPERAPPRPNESRASSCETRNETKRIRSKI